MPLVATTWLLVPSRRAAVWTEHGHSFPSALEPHLAVLPAHKLLLVDPHTVLVKEVSTTAGAWSPGIRPVRPAVEEGAWQEDGDVVIVDTGHLILQVMGDSAAAAGHGPKEISSPRGAGRLGPPEG